MEGILNRFALLAGLGAEQAGEWSFLCQGADEELGALLRDESYRETERYLAACAALAFYRYTLAAAGEESFSAGDVSVTRRDAGLGAKELWRQAQSAAADIFRDNEFVFRRTRHDQTRLH